MISSGNVTVVDAGYRSTHYWVIGAGTSRLIVDMGYPGTMGMMRAQLRRLGVPMDGIRYGLATHYHIDHAGLAQELKHEGLQLVVLESQRAAIPQMKAVTKPRDGYVEISLYDNVQITFADSRGLLEQIGLAGEILPTPGHSDDSVSLLLDDGRAFTGDLTHPSLIGEDAAGRAAVESWRRLVECGALQVYPGHGPVWQLSAESPHVCAIGLSRSPLNRVQ